MGYFANGTDWMIFQDNICSTCARDSDGDCPIIAMHLLYNYDECNKKDSLLHKMIPIDDDGFCRKCNFYKKQEPSNG